MPKIGQPFKKGSAFSGDDDVTGLAEGYEEGPYMGEGAEDYNPAQSSSAERQRQLDRLLDYDAQTFIDERFSSSVTTGGQNPDSLRQFGDVGDFDMVPFETEQSKSVAALQQELDAVKKAASSVDASLVDEPMTVSKGPKKFIPTGDPQVDAIRKKSADIDFEYEMKKAKRKGLTGDKLVTNQEFFKEDGTPKTYREYYNEIIVDLESDIEISKMQMGTSYEQTAREINYDRATQGQGLDAVDRELAINEEGLMKKPSKRSKDSIKYTGKFDTDVARPRQDISAAINQVPKGTKETGDIFKGQGTFGRFDKDLEEFGITKEFRKVAEKNYNNALQKEIAQVSDNFKPSPKSKKPISEQIMNKAKANLNARDYTIDKLVTKYKVDYYNSAKGKAIIMDNAPRLDIVKSERYSAGIKDTSLRLGEGKGLPIEPGTANKTYSVSSQPNPRYSTTAKPSTIEYDKLDYLTKGEGDFFNQTTMKNQNLSSGKTGLGWWENVLGKKVTLTDPNMLPEGISQSDINESFGEPKPQPGVGSGDRSRAVFKNKYGAGNVVAGSKNTKPTDLPKAVLETDINYQKAFQKGLAKGLDEVAAAIAASKAVKAAQSVMKKTNMLSIPMMTKGSADKFLEQFFPGRRSGGY